MAGLVVFLLSLRRLLFGSLPVRPNAISSTGQVQKQFLHSVMGRIFVRPYRCEDCDSPSGRAASQRPGAASAVRMAMYRGEQMTSKPSGKETWERIAAQIREHGLPKRGAPKKGSVDTGIGRLADALLIRAERTIAELKLNDQQRSYLIRVLRSRLRSMVTLADRRSSPRNA
jgi:hypothetical protein